MDSITGNTYYVATSGNDDHPGTMELPWATWQKAFNTARQGDMVYFRGGIWFPTSIQELFSNEVSGQGTNPGSQITPGNGSPDKMIRFLNYPGEAPILDCSRMQYPKDVYYGIIMMGFHHVHLKGLTIVNVGQKIAPTPFCFGMKALNCHDMIFENIVIHDIVGTAFLYIGSNDKNIKDDTFFLNCDAYDNSNLITLPGIDGNGGNGFIISGGVRSTYKIEGCRSWNNSNNGFELEGNSSFEVNHCWSFKNGQLEGEGYGFLFHGVTRKWDETKAREIVTCIASGNRSFGFFLSDHNDNSPTLAEFHDNSAYINNVGFGFYQNMMYSCAVGRWVNNLAYKNTLKPFESYGLQYTGINNSWKPDRAITDNDFESLNEEEMKRERQPDGSLPEINFLKPKSSSILVNAGIGISQP